jgi:hypothetical protein
MRKGKNFAHGTHVNEQNHLYEIIIELPTSFLDFLSALQIKPYAEREVSSNSWHIVPNASLEFRLLSDIAA